MYIKLNGSYKFELKTHLLIAGATGSGKSVCMHTAINSTIYQPNIEYLMIDLKRVELTSYDGLYSVHKIATSMDDALSALGCACKEMERRYKVMERSHQKLYKGRDLVIAIDEVAELTQGLDRKRNQLAINYLSKLARLGRASKIHLIIATQYPTSKVLPMQLLMNVENRICLKCSAQNSRVVIGDSSASALKRSGIGRVKLESRFDIETVGIYMFDDKEEIELIKQRNFIDAPYMRRDERKKVKKFDKQVEASQASPQHAQYKGLRGLLLRWLL